MKKNQSKDYKNEDRNIVKFAIYKGNSINLFLECLANRFQKVGNSYCYTSITAMLRDKKRQMYTRTS